MSRVLFIALIAILSVVVISSESLKHTKQQFEEFIEKYERHYSSKEEYEVRYHHFLRNLKIAEERNKEQSKATFGITKFSDWSEEEMLLHKMSPIAPEEFAESCLAPNVTKYSPHISSPKAPPTSWDWRTKGVVTSVKNQGQCGSCWTFSTIGNIEGQYALQGNKLTNFSEQQIVDCSHGCAMEEGQSVCNQGCDGGWMWSAMMDIISWGGVETEAAYPYIGESTESCLMNNKTDKLYAPLLNYTCIGEDENQILLNLVSMGPLSIAMNADLLETYDSGIIDPSAWEDDDDGCDPSSLDHALLIVGYGVETGVFEDTDFWIIKNSWGEDWGEDGYFRIIRGVGACGLNEAVTCSTLKPIPATTTGSTTGTTTA